MIKKVVLKNFLSYDRTETEFDGSTIAVVGENGAGKSAFLEAIPYAYFGIGRDTNEKLSRINGDGSHEVQIWEDDSIIITRGRKSNGKGYSEVRVSGELVAKGVSADAWIANRLGMDGYTFMLVAFFGLSDSHSDKLLRVQPSLRLEGMQKLANVGPYRAMLKMVTDRYIKAERKFETEQARVQGAEAALVDEEKLRDALSSGNKVIANLDRELSDAKNTRRDLQVEEDAYRAFVKEKERVSVERHSLAKMVKGYEQELETLKEQVEADAETANGNLNDLAGWVKKLSALDETKLSTRMSDTLQESGAAKAELSLKELATGVPSGTAECPLCGQSVTEEIVAAWGVAVVDLREKIKALKGSSERVDSDLEDIADLKEDISESERENAGLVKSTQKAEKRIKELKHEITVRTSERAKKDDRFIFLTEKLGDEYQGLLAKIENAGDKISEVQASKHNTVGQIIQLKEALARNKASRKIITEAKKTMKVNRLEMSAANLLKKAWSRYGIPLQLTKALNEKIEVRASAVYQEFDGGRIEVREVEDRGKPGIQFYLVDRKGDRTFNQLSLGEKVMFFVAIRVAIAQIVAEDNPIKIDYLVLDEVMGNLSPKRRDDLVRLINKVLRKLFPQVIMVSHTEMRDIFSQTLLVTAENDVSKVEVA